MGNAVCWRCIKDEYLQKIVKADGEPIECSVCGEDDQNAFTVEQLGELMEPILREHFRLGEEVKMFGEDDSEWWEQKGEPLSWAVQTVLGQYFDFEDEIVDAVVEAEDVWPPDGDVAFFDTSCNYVESRIALSHYYAEWDYLLTELKHSRRFFSPSAQALFGKLFEDVETLKAWNDETKKLESVVLELPEGTELFRSRICNSKSTLTEIYKDPLKHVGPPPKEHARAGRMNAEGVVVLYGAMDAETCLAEMRPALGGDSVIISLRTTKQLRLLDFSRLERARGGTSLSYFQPDFTEQVEKRAFLRRLHGLIAQPITPGREADYLITQTMAEYLAHVCKQPFDGVLFASVQRAGGVNIVLFPDPHTLTETPADAFPTAYVDGSIKLFSTQSIEYQHHEKQVSVFDGEVWVHHEPNDDPDDDM